MIKKLYFWVEEYLFAPKSFLQKLLSFVLLPLSFLWCIGAYFKKFISKPQNFYIPIISIGNLTIGGSGKTPVAIAIAKQLNKPAIVLRGYGRKSKGLFVVSEFGNIKQGVDISGDEAALFASVLKNTTVIVSEDRIAGILKAKELGADVVLLDDAFGKFNILKFNILLKTDTAIAKRCIPSGAYRLPSGMEKYANDIWVENIDFYRKTYIENETDSMVLVTAIANAKRLDKFLPNSVIKKHILQDHAYFSKEFLGQVLLESGAKSILTTQKDFVKMQEFNLPISILKLDLEFKSGVFDRLNHYLSAFQISFGKIS